MRRRSFLSVAAGLGLSPWSPAGAAARPGQAGDELAIALMPYSGSERRLFEQWVARFESEHAGVTVRIIAAAPESFKASLTARLAAAQPDADLYYWFAGTRLRELAARALVAPLDPVWAAAGMDAAFGRAMKDVVSWNGHPYAVPLNFYQWGFYYRRSTFARLGLTVPSDWPAMQAMAMGARRGGLAPCLLGTGDRWACAAWFDFLDLRLNGLAFHLALTQGQVPFTDARVQRVFEAWQAVRDADWYDREALGLTWRDATPYLLHDRAATFLMGNFFESALPAGLREDIGFFPFPRMAAGVADYEEGPTDVLVQSARARRPDLAAMFLAWTARPDIQRMLADPFGKLPTHAGAPLPDDALTRAGATLLRHAAGYAQYFDRDSPERLASAGIAVFNDFVARRLDVPGAMHALESARARLQEPA